MKKKKYKKLNKKRLFLSLLLLCMILYLYINSHHAPAENTNFISSLGNDSEYDMIKQDTNQHYAGIGQEKVKQKDGNFSYFYHRKKSSKNIFRI